MLWWFSGLFFIGVVASVGLWWQLTTSNARPPESAPKSMNTALPLSVRLMPNSTAGAREEKSQKSGVRDLLQQRRRCVPPVGGEEALSLKESKQEALDTFFLQQRIRHAQVFLPSGVLPVRHLLAQPIASNVLELSAVPLKPKRATNIPRKCYNFKNKGGVWLLDAYGGPAYSLPIWRVYDSELDTYAAERRRTETPGGAFNAGLRVSYFLHPNIALRAGLHYDQWVERFEHFDPDFIRYHVVVTQKLINGQWVVVTDTVGVEYGSNYIKTYNRFGLLDVPLQIGFEWRRGSLGVSANAGMSMNFWFHKRGYILDTDGQPVSFTSPNGEGHPVYRSRVGLSAFGSIQWFYHLAPNTRVFAEPYFRAVLQPITLPAYPIEQSQHLAGLRLGVSHILE